MAAATGRVPVGTTVANAALRPPVLAAKTAIQLDQAGRGRIADGVILNLMSPAQAGRAAEVARAAAAAGRDRARANAGR